MGQPEFVEIVRVSSPPLPSEILGEIPKQQVQQDGAEDVGSNSVFVGSDPERLLERRFVARQQRLVGGGSLVGD